ncbi:hypothetical protein EV126DRAFT_428271 [Verticillium dahliae]|nr:hypothetical protein EV126DRAFT_428271 [Verticillium dahliae]
MRPPHLFISYSFILFSLVFQSYLFSTEGSATTQSHASPASSHFIRPQRHVSRKPTCNLSKEVDKDHRRQGKSPAPSKHSTAETYSYNRLIIKTT